MRTQNWLSTFLINNIDIGALDGIELVSFGDFLEFGAEVLVKLGKFDGELNGKIKTCLVYRAIIIEEISLNLEIFYYACFLDSV